MGSDWQWGKDNGLWGDDGIPYGINSPSWNDDWEYDLRSQGYKTIKEWNSLARIVKDGESGRYLPSSKITVFSESQTTVSKNVIHNDINQSKKYFATFGDAKSWAKKNPWRAITRSEDGKGFIEK